MIKRLQGMLQDMQLLPSQYGSDGCPDPWVQGNTAQVCRLSTWVAEHASKLSSRQYSLSQRVLDWRLQVVNLQKLRKALLQQSAEVEEARYDATVFLEKGKQHSSDTIVPIGDSQVLKGPQEFAAPAAELDKVGHLPLQMSSFCVHVSSKYILPDMVKNA